MPEPRLRSRSKRRVKRVTPGGRVAVHHVDRKPAKARCGGCGMDLKGVPREKPSKLGSIPKTRRRPERPYGGVLCSRCLKRKIMLENRK